MKSLDTPIWPPHPGEPGMGVNGPVVPPPSGYYPYQLQVSLSMTEGLVSTGPGIGAPLIGLPPSDDTKLTLLKTAAGPLKHGDVVQFQCQAANPYQGGQLFFTSEETNIGYGNGVFINYPIMLWAYRETYTIQDPRSRFAIYRADDQNQEIIGPTDIRIVTSNGSFMRRNPAATIPGKTYVSLTGDGLIDQETIFTIVAIP